MGHLRLIGICVYTANVKQKMIWFVQVVFSVNIMMQMLHTQKTATNIERFEPLDQSPIALQFQEIDKKLLTELFIKNDAKFHKSCTSQFSDMKIERAEKMKGK